MFFIPLAKADAAQRLVYGSIDETLDHAGEVMDYATAKPAFAEWSANMSKASGGKNLGNIRGQHDLKKAAGRLTSIDFDDTAKRISFCAHIVDDQDWAKVEAGVYTGFSPGGSYAKRWKDGAAYRYTPKVGELSIVDCPCIPSGTFTMVKADGGEAEVEFVMDKAYEPGNEATKERAETMAKAAGKGTFKDHVMQARADLIFENAAEALVKMADTDGAAAAGNTDAQSDGATDTVAALDAALAKAGKVLVVDGGPVTAARAYAASAVGGLLKADVEMAIAASSPDAVLVIGADLAKSLVAVEAIRTATLPLAKGLYSIGDVASSLQSFAWIAQDVCCEANSEGDGSPLPQMAVNIVNSLKGFLVALIEEEVSEMLARTQDQVGDAITLVIDDGDDDTMELANKIIDLVKSDAARMEKAGKRNSKTDAASLQTIHDKACEMGAACSDGGAAEKVAGLEAERDRLAKSVDKTVPVLEQLTTEVSELRKAHADQLAKMQGELDRIGAQPGATKIELAISKEAENGELGKSVPELTFMQKLAAEPDGHKRAQMVLNGRR
jgi:hypothetical protein